MAITYIGVRSNDVVSVLYNKGSLTVTLLIKKDGELSTETVNLQMSSVDQAASIYDDLTGIRKIGRDSIVMAKADYVRIYDEKVKLRAKLQAIVELIDSADEGVGG
jgi:hypothetical protein